MAFTYTFYTCKGKKNEIGKTELAKKPKDESSSHLTGERFVSKYEIEEQQNYYEQ